MDTNFLTEKLKNINKEYQIIETNLSDLQLKIATNNSATIFNKIKELNQQRLKLLPIIETTQNYFSNKNQLTEIQEQIQDEQDSEFLSIYKDEEVILKKNHIQFEGKLLELLLPEDENSEKNIFLEIRAGTGGDEATLFVKNLLRMYTRFLEKNHMTFECISMQETGIGIKEVILFIKNKKAYNLLHLEAGIHRVQRIPETESNGRIHTSACTVAVMPEVSEVDLEIKLHEIRIDVFRSSGPGGQSVNTTDSAVRITHIPTGVVVSCQDEKSQHKNKAKAMAILRSRLKEKEMLEKHEQQSAEKKIQVGSGDRSGKIRTYNFPQNRITDHRVAFTSQNLDGILEGDLMPIIEKLQEQEKKEKITHFMGS